MTRTSPHRAGGSGDTIESRYAAVCQRVADAARHAGRSPGEVILVAVTKNADPEQIRALLAIGHRDFGENRAQVLVQHAAIVEEYLARQKLVPSTRRVHPTERAEGLFAPNAPDLAPSPALPSGKDGVRWHMIGHLQRNKARKVVEFVRLVHSVDSLRLAEELQTIAVKRDHPIEVLLQVNCSGESQKHGCHPSAAVPLAEQIATMVNVRLRGLMTMAAAEDSPDQARRTFARCRELFDDMARLNFGEYAPFNILSMGMSNDFEAAIAEGANIVRVGSAIFGDVAPGVEHPEPPSPDEPSSPDEPE
ncbi:MAG: YggS family pyridoxal phosphate-dependent enzyme [Planctomycetota bacterium]|nr:YggS family pyridoxal phosphate-dependent enzyme [Planctomycetota bacterium]